MEHIAFKRHLSFTESHLPLVVEVHSGASWGEAAHS